MYFPHLSTGKRIFSEHARSLESMLQVIHGLFLGQRCHENFVDDRLRRQPAGNFRKAFAHAGFGKQDDILELAFPGRREGRFQQRLDLSCRELMGIIDEYGRQVVFFRQVYHPVI